jgi:hypothetical protein
MLFYKFTLFIYPFNFVKSTAICALTPLGLGMKRFRALNAVTLNIKDVIILMALGSTNI